MATRDELKRRASQIKNEVEEGRNTANRVGGLLEEFADSVATKTELDNEISRAGEAEKSLKDKLDILKNSGYLYAGLATPTTNPGTPDWTVFYIATTAGRYSNFGNIEVLKGETTILKWNNGTWTKNVIKPMTDFNSVFDANGESLNESFSQINESFSQINQNFGDVLNANHPGRIALGIWYNDFNSYKHIVIPIQGNDNVTITPNSTAVYTVLKSYPTPVAGETPDFATGYSDRVTIHSQQSVVMPDDALWLYVQSTDYNDSILPLSITINGIERLESCYVPHAISTLGQECKSIRQENQNNIKKSELNVVVTSNNIANPNFIVDGKFIGSTGAIQIGSDWSYIRIPVEVGKTYTFGGFYLGRTGYYAFYDADDITLISFKQYNDPNGRTRPITVTVPENAAYLYIDIKTEKSPSNAYTYLQINEGLELKPYEEYKSEIDEILNYSIIDSELRKRYKSDVLRKPDYIYGYVNKGYISYSDGEVKEGGYIYTDFISVSKGDIVKVKGAYCSNAVAILAAYSSFDVYGYIQSKSIKGTSTLVSFDYEVPDGVAYIRLCCYESSEYQPSYCVISHIPYIPYDKIASDVDSSDDKLPTMGILHSIIGKPSSNIRLYPQTKMPCVSFQFDDIPDNDAQIVSLFESYGLTCAFAFIASEANITAKAKTYKKYQGRGFQIMSHSIDGKVFNTTNYTYATAQTAIITALTRIEKAGMICNGFVSPSSSMDITFLPILKANHAYAFTYATSSAENNSRNQDTCQLHRFNMQSTPLADIKTYIDNCITNNQIMTFYGHAADLGTTYSGEIWSLEKIAAIIEYCVAKRNAGLLYIGGTDDCVKYFFGL